MLHEGYPEAMRRYTDLLNRQHILLLFPSDQAAIYWLDTVIDRWVYNEEDGEDKEHKDREVT